MTGYTLEQLRKKHKGRANKHRVAFPNLKEDRPPTLSNSKGGKGGFRRDPMAHRWRRGAEEKPETIREIEAKKTRVASLTNKQGYSYITPESDPRAFGRK